MKICYCDDLHCEFSTVEIKNTEKADVLVLGGDIIVAADLLNRESETNKSRRFHDFFEQVCSEFPEIVYIMGNHCHYHGDFQETYPRLKKFLGYIPNLNILDKETFVYDDVTFIGGTLWTDFNKEDPLTLSNIRRMMNDFRLVSNGDRVFTPEDALEDHKKMIQFIKDTVDPFPYKKFVVCAHHAPSKRSTKPQYEADWLMNGGYSTDLDQFIIDRPQIKLFLHGHTHHDFDYQIGTTRVVCRPRGYAGWEPQADSFTPIFLDV